MAANLTPDQYEQIGHADDATDDLSSTPIGSATVPPADERLTFYPIADGTPAPAA